MDILQIFDWKAGIALLALVLSQLPPVRQMIKGKKLRLAIADIAQFTHVFGNTNMSLWIDFDNVGGQTLTVRRIEAILVRRDGPAQRLTARTYWVTESFSRDKAIELPVAEICLKPGDKWSGYLHFWDTALWSRAIQESVKSLTSKFRDDITAKLSKRDKELAHLSATERPLVEADRGLVEELTDIVKKVKRLEQAEYELFVAAYEHPSDPPLRISGFDLTLFQSDVHDIFEDTADYKYGFGVHWSSTKTKYVTVYLRSKSEEESKRRFNQLSQIHM